MTVRLHGMHGAKATYYGGEELLTLEPGQTLSGAAWWQDASNIRGTELTQFTARGVYALLYQRDEPEVGQGSAGKLRWLPLRAARAMQERAAAIWDDQSVQGFLIAELIGDRAALPEGDAVVMEETGLAHLFAVSGLHCAFLVTLLGLLTPGNRRRTLCAVTIPALLFYMVMVGLSPSVVRACIMQIFLLTAPLFRRSSDGLTALAAALGVILLANPFSAGSVSLQLSFAAALGMVLLTPRLYQTLSGWYHGQRRLVERMIRFLAANLAATLGAMVFTAPLIAWYFNIFVIVAPLAGLLAVPAAGWSFMAAFITTLLGLVWLPLGQVLGWVSFALVKYILWVARTLTALPFHAVYFNNRILIYWMLYSYIAFIGCAVTKDPAAEVRHGGGAVGDDAGGVRMAGRYRPVRCHERPGAGCGAGRERGPVVRQRGGAGGLRQQQQLRGRRRRGGGSAGQSGRAQAAVRGGDPLPRRPHQRPVRGNGAPAGGDAVSAGHRGRIRRAAAAGGAGGAQGHGRGVRDLPHRSDAGGDDADGLSAGGGGGRPQRTGPVGAGHGGRFRPADHRRPWRGAPSGSWQRHILCRT